MHTSVEQQQHLRLDLDLGICNQQAAANDIAKETNLQMPGKNCKNIQQHRGRRRQRHGHGGVGSGFVGIFWSINLGILICLAHSTNAVPTDNISSSSSNSNSNSASSTVVMVAVTPSSISSTSSSSISSTSPESLLEPQQPQGQCLFDGLWVAETTVRCEKQASCRAIQRTGHCCPDYKCDCEKDGKTYANGYKLVDPDTPCTVCYCKGGEIVCSSVTCFRRDDCMPKYVAGRCCPEYDNCPILDNNPSLGETSSAPSTTTSPVGPAAPPAGFNWNITIKEITKPTEIRITDNQKAKPIFTRKAHTTEAPTAVVVAASSSTTTTTITTANLAESSTTTATAAAATTEATATTTAMPAIDTAATPTSSFALSQDTNPKALPVNSSNESLKLIASVSYKEQQQQQQQQQQQPLVTYNADDPSKVNIKREYTTEGADVQSYGLSSTFIQNGFRDALVDSGAAAAELEPDTAGSDNIYHIISTTEGPSGSSSTERQLNSEPTSTPSDLSSTYASYDNSTAELELSTEGLPASSSETPLASSTQSLHHMEEEDVPQVESNPAYPSLPEDDFSLRDVNFPLVELEDIVEADNKDEQRSIVSPFERDNKRSKLVTEAPTINLETNGSGNGSGSGSGDMELYQPLPSPSEQLTAQQVPLMYSAEDSSAELGKIRRNHSEHETSAELESGSGSGSGELREPTTPRTRHEPVQDIDELGSGVVPLQGTAQDPKADAESLKLNESQEQSPSDAGKAAARAEKSFVELSGGDGRLGGAGEAALRPDRIYLQRILLEY